MASHAQQHVDVGHEQRQGQVEGPAFDLIDAADCEVVSSVAAQAVDRVRGVGHQAPAAEAIQGLLNLLVQGLHSLTEYSTGC